MLKEILKWIKNNKQEINIDFPSIWFDHKSKSDVVSLNPYEKYEEIMTNIINGSKDLDYSKSLASIGEIKNPDKGNWIKDSKMYSSMVRASTSWDHNGDGKLIDQNNIRETGTFLKSIMILPYIKKMGIDVFYMLPITKFSLKNKKGDLGSPYAVSNFYKFDDMLNDPLLEDNFSIEEQFKAFVEACHMMGIKVIIDIIPRTNATETEFIVEDPSWFYWIPVSEKPNYKPPFVKEHGKNWIAHTVENLNICYKDNDVKKHLSRFVENPSVTHPEAWNDFVRDYKNGKISNLLDEIEKRFKVTTAPAFSDGINDPQPAWTDITFFRMYMDHPKSTKHNVSKDQPPYILFDTIKSNLFPGEVPNHTLWDRLSDIIPYYQNNFGIDGARIDMGHALPEKLTDLIIAKAREVDENFCFIAEEMNLDNDKISKKVGYNLIIGDSFMKAYRYDENQMFDFIKKVSTLKLPSFAAAETHDTGRIVSKKGSKELSKMMTVLNMLIPNTVPFINSGQEIFEKQPINTGIDCRPNEDKLLDKNDPFYGKLALFDKYQFHYLNDKTLYEKLVELEELNIKNNFGEIKANGNVIELIGENIYVVLNNNDEEVKYESNDEIVFTTQEHSKGILKPFELNIYKR